MPRRWDAGRGLAALACAAAVAVSARQARGDEVPRVVVLDSPGVRPFDEPIRAQTVSTVALGPATVTMPAGGAIVWSWQPESAAPPVDDDIAAVRREPAPRPEPTAAERLSEARRAFVAGDIDAAGDAARAVLALRGATRRQKADASTLEADCAQASGQPARAIELYRSIADQYRDLPAGETALFAATPISVRGEHAKRGIHMQSRRLVGASFVGAGLQLQR